MPLMIPNNIAACLAGYTRQAAPPPLALCPNVLIPDTIVHSSTAQAFASVVLDFVFHQTYSSLEDSNVAVRLGRKAELW
jgi:hypothetical protein